MTKSCCELNLRLHRDNAGRAFAVCGVCERVWEARPTRQGQLGDYLVSMDVDGLTVEMVLDDGEGERDG